MKVDLDLNSRILEEHNFTQELKHQSGLFLDCDYPVLIVPHFQLEGKSLTYVLHRDYNYLGVSKIRLQSLVGGSQFITLESTPKKLDCMDSSCTNKCSLVTKVRTAWGKKDKVIPIHRQTLNLEVLEEAFPATKSDLKGPAFQEADLNQKALLFPGGAVVNLDYLLYILWYDQERHPVGWTRMSWKDLSKIKPISIRKVLSSNQGTQSGAPRMGFMYGSTYQPLLAVKKEMRKALFSEVALNL